MLVTGKLRCSGREKPLLALHALDPEHFGKSLYERHPVVKPAQQGRRCGHRRLQASGSTAQAQLVRHAQRRG